MIPLMLVSVLLAPGRSSAQTTQPGHLGPACKKVPDLEWAGKTVEQVKPAADTLWGVGKWNVVVVQDYDDVKSLTVVDQHPHQLKGLTAGELMHLYVDGSSGYMDTVAEKTTIFILGIGGMFLGWRLLRK